MTTGRRGLAAALAALAALALASCGDGGGFDNGSRPDDGAEPGIGALEKQLRSVRPDRREGVQRTLACERDRIRKAGGRYRVDARKVREAEQRYARDPGVADC